MTQTADPRPPLAQPLTCWVVSDGKPGMENQCLGLAERMGLTPTVKRIALRPPWKQLSPWLQFGLSHAFAPQADAIVPPWPDVLIATGRQSVPAPLLVKRASGGRTTTIQIQDCALAPRCFDLVIVPQHDRLRGDNVLVTYGALHRVTPQKLAAAAAEFAPTAASLPHPRVAVLLGGDNGVYTFSAETAQKLAADLKALQAQTGAGLLITPSRRTGPMVTGILRAALEGDHSVFWDGSGANPYYGYLGMADAIVVTGDSVGMVSEACSTGKPVYVVGLPGGSPKFDRFHQALQRDGLARPLSADLFASFFAAAGVRPLDDMFQSAAAAWDAITRNRSRFVDFVPSLHADSSNRSSKVRARP